MTFDAVNRVRNDLSAQLDGITSSAPKTSDTIKVFEELFAAADRAEKMLPNVAWKHCYCVDPSCIYGDSKQSPERYPFCPPEITCK